MKIQLVISVTILVFLASCNQTGKAENKQPDAERSRKISQAESTGLKTINLDFGFRVTVGQEEEYEKSKTYTYFKLTRGAAAIYIDSSLTEYEFENEIYPIVLKTGDHSFELLFEINDRPNKNYVKRLFIQNNKFIKLDKLPTFEAKMKDINGDGINEYADYWDYPQSWGENNTLSAYNPILYFSVTNSGLRLDSNLTRERNEIIYGRFYGFSFSEKYEQPISVTDKFEQEIKLITSAP